MRLAILDSDSGFVRVLIKRAGDLGWQYRRLEAAPRTEDLVAMRVNALVVDLALLGPGAWEFLERVSAALPGLGIVVCTGRSTVSQRVRGLRLGADDWVTKPCHPEEVLARVEAVVRRRKRASARVDTGPLMAGDLEIRADQFQAFVRASSVDLTRREFEVLQLLAQAEGKVLQREEIYQAVWGYTMAHGDRSVDVFIRKVRQKLEKASPDWNYIHTHFGVGYRFEPERRAARGRRSAQVVHAAGRRRRAAVARGEPARASARSRRQASLPSGLGRDGAPRPEPAVQTAGAAPSRRASQRHRGATRRRSTRARERASRAGGRVGPCASDATTATSPSATSFQAAVAGLLAVLARSGTARSAGRASRPRARRAGRRRRRGSRPRCARGARPARRSRAHAARGGVAEAAADALERGLHAGPSAPGWALARVSSSSLWRMRPTSSWPSSRAAAHLERIAAASAPRSSRRGRGSRRVGDAEVRADVRRHDDRAGALGDGRAGELEAGLHVGRAVVDAGQQVEVKVGVRASRAQHRRRAARDIR